MASVQDITNDIDNHMGNSNYSAWYCGIAAEPESGAKFSESMIKQITGGEKILLHGNYA